MESLFKVLTFALPLLIGGGFINGVANAAEGSGPNPVHSVLNVLPEKSMSSNGMPTKANGNSWGEVLNGGLHDTITK